MIKYHVPFCFNGVDSSGYWNKNKKGTFVQNGLKWCKKVGLTNRINKELTHKSCNWFGQCMLIPGLNF